MKILITTGIFKPEAGGPASYTEQLAIKLTDLGHTIKVITYSDSLKYDMDDKYKFPVVRVVRGNKILNYIKYFLTVLKNLKQCDFVYLLDHSSAGLPVFLATRLINKKYIIRIGGDFIWEKYINSGVQPVTLKDFYKNNLYKKYNKLFYLTKTILRQASFIIFNSQDQRELFCEYYELNKPKTTVIYNPLPDFNYDIKREKPEKQITYFGRFVIIKNIEAVIKGFSELKDKDFKLLLIGDGPEKDNIRELVKHLNLENRVKILPTLSGEELWQKVINSYYVVLPSWTDISPNQVYECLYFGIPILLTQENYLSLDTSGWLKINPAEPEDIAVKMKYLLDSENYEAFVNSQKQFDFKNSWDDVVNKHLDLFNQI